MGFCYTKLEDGAYVIVKDKALIEDGFLKVMRLVKKLRKNSKVSTINVMESNSCFTVKTNGGE